MRFRMLAVSSLVALLGLGPVATAQATTPPPPPTRSFIISCPFVKFLQADPIMQPGVSPSAHMHEFFGNVTTNAYSTYASQLAGKTSCSDPKDTAGYWSPPLEVNGQTIPGQAPGFTPFVVYYTGTAADHVPPADLRLMVGNPMATKGPIGWNMYFGCGNGFPGGGSRHGIPDCRPYNRALELHLVFPNCLAVNAQGQPYTGAPGQPYSPATVGVYAQKGLCPASHPYQILTITERLRWIDPSTGVAPNPAQVSFSSGPWFTVHGDYWQTWNQTELNARFQACMVNDTHCGDQSGALS